MTKTSKKKNFVNQFYLVSVVGFSLVALVFKVGASKLLSVDINSSVMRSTGAATPCFAVITSNNLPAKRSRSQQVAGQAAEQAPAQTVVEQNSSELDHAINSKLADLQLQKNTLTFFKELINGEPHSNWKEYIEGELQELNHRKPSHDPRDYNSDNPLTLNSPLLKPFDYVAKEASEEYAQDSTTTTILSRYTKPDAPTNDLLKDWNGEPLSPTSQTTALRIGTLMVKSAKLDELLDNLEEHVEHLKLMRDKNNPTN